MSLVRNTIFAGAIAGAIGLMSASGGSALTVNAGHTGASASGGSLIHQVQRGRRIAPGRGGRRVFRGGRRRGGIGPGGAAAIGLGLGILGAIAAQNAARANGPGVSDDAVAYCMRRFRTYNPETGLYRGYDGYMHRCP
ncbi:MAG: BA14K family protein [Hyphomicrobiales bacterium]|nr:BA14K family protein [Hyphomicrobiales bacterium]